MPDFYTFEPKDKLKPCPFCGCGYILCSIRKWPNLDWDFEAVIFCDSCNAQTSAFSDSKEISKERAIEKWERRAD